MTALLRTSEAAQALGLSARTLERWRQSGLVNLPFVKLGNSVRYKSEDVERCIASRTVHNTSEEIGNGN